MHSGLFWYVCPNGHTTFSSFSAFVTSVKYHLAFAHPKPKSRWSVDGMSFAHEITQEELEEWEQWYLPPSGMPKDSLILDVGARDGDTALFYVKHGYLNLRLVEPSPVHRHDLSKNAIILERKYGAKIEIRGRPFERKDLEGASFAKFDCEGCEYEIDLPSLAIPWAAEVHKKIKPDRNGVYPYVTAMGYRRSETGR